MDTDTQAHDVIPHTEESASEGKLRQPVEAIRLDDLLFRVRIDKKLVVRTLAAAGAHIIRYKDVELVTKEDMFLFFAELERTRPPKFYALPDVLANSAYPPHVALRKIYQHKAAFPACMSPEQGRLLQALILNLAPKRSLEIGSFIGCSSLWILSALEEIGEGALVCVDLFEPVLPFPCSNMFYIENPLEYVSNTVAEAGLSPRFIPIRGKSEDIGARYDELVAPRFYGEPLDFLLIDGDHRVEGASRDFCLFAPRVRPGGYIMLHDTNSDSGWDGPRHILDRLAEPSAYEVINLDTRPNNFGMAVLRKRG